jgi:Flp pilus assembly protein TadG
MLNSPIKCSLRVRRTRERGSVTVETALVLPLVLLLILGVFEYGRYAMTVQLFDHAAREGVRYAITHLQPVTIDGTTYGNSVSDVLDIVKNVTPGITLSGQKVELFASDDLGNQLGDWTEAQPGQSITLRITGDHEVAVTKFLHLPSRIPVTAQATMNAESN